ncbi:hypothetical protein ScPMuIL_013652 [Solemya velum]
MADTGQGNNIMEVETAQTLGPDTIIVTESDMPDGDTEEVSEDILQQALEEAGEALDTSVVEYAESDAVAVHGIVNGVGPEATLVSVEEGSQDAPGFETATYTVVGEVSENDTLALSSNIRRVLMTADGQISEPLQEVGDIVDVPQQMNLQIEDGSSLGLTSGILGNQIQSGNDMSAVTIVQTNELSVAPLGSSANPIRIIQQGNQYTPMQQLTTDQLQQIMQVVQQQHVAKTTQEGGGSILYNPQTNTKIVYRVIYPSELHKATSGSQANSSQQTVLITHPGQRRPYRKRNREEEEKIDGPDLSKEEKEERKKHRPRTRSGRVSKPPKHMVKDYKHIHVLDWDEDYDDSDGGYSDFKYSEEEASREAEMKEMDEDSYVHPGLGATRPKNFKCQICGKAYIGRAGLGRHFRLYPSHGKLDDSPEMEGGAGPERTALNGVNDHLSDDSNTQDSTSSTRSSQPQQRRQLEQGQPQPHRTNQDQLDQPKDQQEVEPVPEPEQEPEPEVQLQPDLSLDLDGSLPEHHIRRRRRGRPRLLYPGPENAVKRQTRLKELIKQCGDEELMEIVLPRLAKVITLWEFLLMKVERGQPLKPHVDDVYREFETLHKQVQKMCKEYLSFLTDTDGQNTNPETDKIQIDNSAVAQSLGLQAGAYEVKKASLLDDKAFQYKLLSKDPTILHAVKPNNVKRTVEIVSQSQIITPNKRVCYSVPVTTIPMTTVSSMDPPSMPQDSQILTVVTKMDDTVPISQNSNMTFLSSAPSFRTPVNSSLKVNDMIPSNSASSTVRLIPPQPTCVTVTVQPNKPLEAEQNHVGIVPQTTCMETGTLTPPPRQQIIQLPPSGTETNGRELVSIVRPVVPKSEACINVSAVNTVNNATVCSRPQAGGDSVNLGGVDSQPVTQLTVLNSNNELCNHIPIEQTAALGVAENGTVQIIDVGAGDITQGTQMDDNITSTMVEMNDNEIIGDNIEGIEVSEGQIITNSNIFQTSDGIIIIQNPDGSTVQLQGGDGQPIPLETVQALLAMDSEGHLLQESEIQQ